MAIAILSDESCRDRPIYVRVSCCRDNNSYCWYVIEEKPWGAESSSLSLSSSSAQSSSSSDNEEEDGNNVIRACKSESDLTRLISIPYSELRYNSSLDGNNDILDCESESDTIRRISIPDSNLRYNSLAVLDSHIYLIGGDIDTEKNEDEKNIGYRHLKLGKSSQWQFGGGNLSYEQYGVAAVGHDGSIYSVGCNQYRLSPDTGILEKLPLPPPLNRGSNPDVLCESHLLALTKEKLFIYMNLGPDDSNIMVSYDLGTKQWDDCYPYFSGKWSTGVVLYNDRYLFSFGSQAPMSPAVTARRKPVRLVVPGVYVFDIQERRWLDEPVKGLRTDGTVLPYCFETHDYEAIPDDYNCGPLYSPYLLQIGKQNDHKLALLWECQYEHPDPSVAQCLLIWSKFILNPAPSSSDPIPPFYASSLTTGRCALDEWTDELFSCAAGL
ncbi:hypothetical protein ACLB2K_000224 [Fragaria x ananassa]